LDAELGDAAEEGVDDGAGLVGVGVDFAAGFDVGGDAEACEEVAEGVVGEVVECGGEEAAVAAESGDEVVGGAGVGKVAAPAAADEDFDAGAGVFFEEGEAWGMGGGGEGFRGGDGGHHAGGTGAEDGEVEMGMRFVHEMRISAIESRKKGEGETNWALMGGVEGDIIRESPTCGLGHFTSLGAR
jgi:hypothetical protein